MATNPPFHAAPTVKNAPWYPLDVPYSDGEERQWPGKPNYRPSDDGNYKVKLGAALAEQLGLTKAENGNYYLKEMPTGYGVFETDQSGDGKQVYKRLFGHPSGRYYDSILRFLPHFLWLASGMVGNCSCHLCGRRNRLQQPKTREPQSMGLGGTLNLTDRLQRRRDFEIKEGYNSTRSNSSSRPATLASGRERRQVKPSGEAYAVDEESTPDVYKDILRKLYLSRDSRKGIEDDIDEMNSIDWRAEQGLLSKHLTKIEQQHSFIPRLGELVLWFNYMPDEHYLIPDPTTNEYKFYSFEQKCFHGFPDWRGGIITAVPTASAADTVDFPDILEVVPKRTSFNTSGFRVETLPNPNKTDKSISKQYRYVPLCQIRPLSHWQFLVRGISPKRLHTSVYSALTCMTTVSLVNKFYYKGSWPEVAIKCKGIYIGSELITIGDAVRISKPATGSHTPKAQPKYTEVLVVKSIRLNLEDIKPEHVEPNCPSLSSRSTITLVGSSYTLNPQHALRQADHVASIPYPIDRELVKSLFRPVGAGIYGSWYPMHPENQLCEVSFEHFIGRLYEPEAVRLWTGISQANGANERSLLKLNFDLSSINAARSYSTALDNRLPESSAASPIQWYWADTRAVALQLETFNGLEVGPYHLVRDKLTLRAWRAMLKIIDGGSLDVWAKDTRLNFKGNTEETDAGRTGEGRRGRKPGSRIIGGKVYGPGEAPELGDEGEDVNTEDELQASQGRRGIAGASSQMVAAGMAISEDEADGDDDQDDGVNSIEDDDDVEDETDALTGNPSNGASEKSRSRSRPRAKVPKTKEQIMSSIEMGSDLDDDEDDEDDEDAETLALLEQPSIIRGGTEESEGGDYNPRVQDFQKEGHKRKHEG